jgi:hypothetical protein
MLGMTDESLAYQEDEENIVKTANLTDVDDKDDVLQFTDRLRGQHTVEEIMSLVQLLKLLRAIGAPNYAYRSVLQFRANRRLPLQVWCHQPFQHCEAALRKRGKYLRKRAKA